MIFTSGEFLCPSCREAHGGLPVRLTGFHAEAPILWARCPRTRESVPFEMSLRPRDSETETPGDRWTEVQGA